MKKRILLFGIPALILVSWLAKGNRTNPETERVVQWDSSETEALFTRACMDCHSNETVWPWYSNFAPVSWSIISHVNEGREHFNISIEEMGKHAYEAPEETLEGEMPITSYKSGHPEARLTDAERESLALGLERTFGHIWEDHDDH